MTRHFSARLFAGAALAAALSASAAHATTVTDAVGDLLPSFLRNTPTTNGFADLDVVTASATFDAQNVYLSATMAGAVGSTTSGFYVWGVDTGAAVPFFQNLHNSDPLHQPDIGQGVNFDTFIVLTPAGAGGTGSVHSLVGEATQALAADAITVDGDTISAVIPRTFLIAHGLDISQFGYNIWPRITGFDSGDVSDFGPDHQNFVGSAVPEPAAWALLIAGFGMAGSSLRRRRRIFAA